MDPKEYGRRAKERKAMGLTWMKMDLGINVLDGIPGTVMRPAGLDKWELRDQPHPFIATEVTDKGIDRLCEYVAAVRENIGYDMPLSMDHLGHIGVKSVIRLGKAYEKFNLEWMEDVIPWYYTDLLKEITRSQPNAHSDRRGHLRFADFETLCREHAVDKIHPDLATSGGILQTHRIGDMAFRYGVPMAMHFAGTPVGCMASVHCAAATRNFLALENHSLDVPFWQDLVTGIEKPIIDKGFIKVPDTPGLGHHAERRRGEAASEARNRILRTHADVGRSRSPGMTRFSASMAEGSAVSAVCWLGIKLFGNFSSIAEHISHDLAGNPLSVHRACPPPYLPGIETVAAAPAGPTFPSAET